MRFRNSSDYFGLVTYAGLQMTLNPATGKAFGAFNQPVAATLPQFSLQRISPSNAINSAVVGRSKVTSHSY
jgi:hypothetical protein